MPCLILKKTSRRTQAVVVSEGIFCVARCCVIFYLQSMKVYLHMHAQREWSAEPFMPSILSLRIFCTAVLSRCKFSPPTVCVLCFLPIHSGYQVRWTYQPGSHRRKVTQDFSSTFFLGSWCNVWLVFGLLYWCYEPLERFIDIMERRQSNGG